MKSKVFRILTATVLTTTLSIINTSCVENWHLHKTVIENTDCYNTSKDTSYYASVPYINHNYVYHVKVKHNTVTYQELDKTRMYINYKTIIGMILFFTAWGSMIIIL